VSTAVYLLNRAAAKSLQGCTPYEAWYNKKPKVHHLRTFGCVVYVKNIGSGISKLTDRSTKMVLIRYESGTKAYMVYYCRRLEPGGSLDRRVNCRRVPQPRWVDARRSAKGGSSRRETGVRGETRGLRVCPAPRSGALAVGGYKRPRERERAALRERRPVLPRAANPRKRALDLPFIGVRKGSRCTMGGVAVC
jgi:hypothetical protein